MLPRNVRKIILADNNVVLDRRRSSTITMIWFPNFLSKSRCDSCCKLFLIRKRKYSLQLRIVFIYFPRNISYTWLAIRLFVDLIAIKETMAICIYYRLRLTLLSTWDLIFTKFELRTNFQSFVHNTNSIVRPEYLTNMSNFTQKLQLLRSIFLQLFINWNRQFDVFFFITTECQSR